MARPGTGMRCASLNVGIRTLSPARSQGQDTRMIRLNLCDVERDVIPARALTNRPCEWERCFSFYKRATRRRGNLVWGSLEAARRWARPLQNCLRFRFEASVRPGQTRRLPLVYDALTTHHSWFPGVHCGRECGFIWDDERTCASYSGSQRDPRQYTYREDCGTAPAWSSLRVWTYKRSARPIVEAESCDIRNRKSSSPMSLAQIQMRSQGATMPLTRSTLCTAQCTISR